MWSNFHTHSSFCDGKGELRDYHSKAGKCNVSSLGFSSHAPLPFECSWCMKPDALPHYLAAINQLNQEGSNPVVYKGLEVDFIPGLISTDNFKNQLDYTIGSIHFVDAYSDGRHWEIDGPHAKFLDGLEKIFHQDIRAVVVRYFELTRQMISNSSPTIVGHMDKIKIQNPGDKFFKESDSWYRIEIEKTLDAIEDSGCIVEVNTRGLYQKKSITPYPSPWILERILKKNIPITLSSDAHHPDDLINQFTELAGVLKRMGFKKMAVLKDNSWQHLDFNENGIAIEHARI